MTNNNNNHERWFSTYEHFQFVIKTSIKRLGFYLFIFFFYDNLIKLFLTSFLFVCFFPSFFDFLFFLFFCANYSALVTTNFSRCCAWLRFAALPKLLFFYSGHPDVSTAMIIIIIIITIIINPNLLLITKLTIKSYLQLISLKKLFRQSTIYIIPFD